MDTLSDIILWIFLFGLVIVTLLTLIEYLVIPKCKNTKFDKWWKRHIIGEDPYDSY